MSLWEKLPEEERQRIREKGGLWEREPEEGEPAPPELSIHPTEAAIADIAASMPEQWKLLRQWLNESCGDGKEHLYREDFSDRPWTVGKYIGRMELTEELSTVPARVSAKIEKHNARQTTKGPEHDAS